MDLGTLGAFGVASLLVLVMPGPAVVYVVTRTLHLGLRGGLVGMLGVECGTLLHVALAAVGLTAVLASSELAFGCVKYAGVAYLAYLGVQHLRAVGPRPGRHRREVEPTDPATFRQGFTVEALNPKTALFFMTFLPQFVDPGGSHVSVQVWLLGLAFVVLALVVDLAYAVSSARLGARLLGSASHGSASHRAVGRASGVVHLGLAGLAATATRVA